MPTFRVLASRTELYLIEAYIKAANMEEAESKFYGALASEEEPLNWIEDFDSTDTEIASIDPLSADHEAAPASSSPATCLYCRQLIEWTGTPAGDSPTERTIPGPWVHIGRSILGEGVGL